MTGRKLICGETSWYSTNIYLFVAVFPLFKTVFLYSPFYVVSESLCSLPSWLWTQSSCLSLLSAEVTGSHDQLALTSTLCVTGDRQRCENDYSSESKGISISLNSKAKKHLYTLSSKLTGSSQQLCETVTTHVFPHMNKTRQVEIDMFQVTSNE